MSDYPNPPPQSRCSSSLLRTHVHTCPCFYVRTYCSCQGTQTQARTAQFTHVSTQACNPAQILWFFIAFWLGSGLSLAKWTTQSILEMSQAFLVPSSFVFFDLTLLPPKQKTWATMPEWQLILAFLYRRFPAIMAPHTILTPRYIFHGKHRKHEPGINTESHL